MPTVHTNRKSYMFGSPLLNEGGTTRAGARYSYTSMVLQPSTAEGAWYGVHKLLYL